MPIETSIDPDRGLITHVASGDVTPEEIARAADRTLADPDFEPGMDALVDLRDASLAALTSDDLRDMVRHARSRIPRRGSGFRAAWVAPRDLEFGLVRMLEVFMEDLPSEHRLFRDINEARRWLAE